MDKKVQILMSTYNGERFIRKQLDSIVKQDYPLSLLIRDDGSTDKTVEIIKEYIEKYGNIELVEGKNVGVIKSFFMLFGMADREADYYSMADQDDIWFHDKISRAVAKLDRMSENEPALYCAAQTLIDAEDNVLKVNMLEVNIKPGFGNSIVENIATGCTCVINKKLLELAAGYTPEYTIMHDWWLYMIASYMGEVYFDTESVMYYRQHGNNTMGSRTNYIEEFKERFSRFSSNKGKLFRQMASFEDYFCKKNDNNNENNDIIRMVMGYRQSMLCRMKCIFSKRIYRQRVMDNIIFKLLFLTNHI